MGHFFNRKTERRDKIQDAIKDLIKGIEKFAPRQYNADRESRYYNYRILDSYVRPLFALLSVISKKQHLDSDRAEFTCELFLKLKDFYDQRETLSIREAIQNRELKNRLGKIFNLFYNKRDLNMGDIETYLKNLKE